MRILTTTSVAVTLRGKPVAKSPYVITVNDFVADPLFTKAWGPGLQGAVTGTPTEFYIKAINKDGQPIPIGGENFNVEIDGPSGKSSPPVVDNGDGTYTVKYEVGKPGPHKIQVNLKTDKGKGPWAPIQNSPFTVNVSPCGADPAKSRVFGPGIEDGVEAGKPTFFNIEARDDKGNKLPWVRTDFSDLALR